MVAFEEERLQHDREVQEVRHRAMLSHHVLSSVHWAWGEGARVQGFCLCCSEHRT